MCAIVHKTVHGHVPKIQKNETSSLPSTSYGFRKPGQTSWYVPHPMLHIIQNSWQPTSEQLCKYSFLHDLRAAKKWTESCQQRATSMPCRTWRSRKIPPHIFPKFSSPATAVLWLLTANYPRKYSSFQCHICYSLQMYEKNMTCNGSNKHNSIIIHSTS